MGRKKKIIFETFNNLESENDLENKNILTKTSSVSSNTNNKKTNDILEKNDILEINDDILEINDDIITICDFKKKEKMYYEVLNKFFKGCTEKEIDLIIEIIEGKHIISLRFLDWFVTRYCNLYKLSISVNNSYNKEINFNINISYKAQLKSFRKRHFDPFRRKKKFIHDFDKQNRFLLTTIGQLNFFRWALSYDIIKYVENNFKYINGKVQHVNSFFQKYTIDSTSCSQTLITSDENLEKTTCSDKSTETNLKLSQQDINLLLTDNNKNIDLIESNHTIKKIKKIKPSKLFKNLKNSQTLTKYPLVSRNIFVEL